MSARGLADFAVGRLMVAHWVVLYGTLGVSVAICLAYRVVLATSIAGARGTVLTNGVGGGCDFEVVVGRESGA